MDTPQDAFNSKYIDLVQEAASFDIQSDEATAAMNNLATFSKCQLTPDPEPEPLPIEPTTFMGKAARAVSRVWDNDTTRVCIKAGGAFAGVALIAHQTIRQDRVMERQALAQANQRND